MPRLALQDLEMRESPRNGCDVWQYVVVPQGWLRRIQRSSLILYIQKRYDKLDDKIISACIVRWKYIVFEHRERKGLLFFVRICLGRILRWTAQG